MSLYSLQIADCHFPTQKEAKGLADLKPEPKITTLLFLEFQNNDMITKSELMEHVDIDRLFCMDLVDTFKLCIPRKRTALLFAP
jgi:hypothetical protein